MDTIVVAAGMKRCTHKIGKPPAFLAIEDPEVTGTNTLATYPCYKCVIKQAKEEINNLTPKHLCTHTKEGTLCLQCINSDEDRCELIMNPYLLELALALRDAIYLYHIEPSVSRHAMDIVHYQKSFLKA